MSAALATPAWSRAEPSPRYRELLALYREMHVEGDRGHSLPPEQTFDGRSLPRQAPRIRQMVQRSGARTLLDYGAGKGKLYTAGEINGEDGVRYRGIVHYWGLEKVTCYDPGHHPFSALPQGQFDGVICTDVLEHCPEEDMPWIVGELFGFARRFVYANVACYPAMKRLPNGENAHCTIRPQAWWRALLGGIAARHPDVRYAVWLETLVERDGKRARHETLVEG